MAGRPMWENPLRAPVAYGRLAVPQLFAELQSPEPEKKLRALASLQDLLHDPERLYPTVTKGYVEKMKLLLEDEDPSVRSKTCEVLGLLCTHSLGRQVLLSSPLLSSLFWLLDDPSSPCRKNVLRVLKLLTLHPSGADALLTLVPKLLLKLQQQQQQEEGEQISVEEEKKVEVNEEEKVDEENQQEQREGLKMEQTEEVKDVKEEEEEEELLVLSLISCCSRRDALPALSSDAVSVLKPRLTHPCTHIRREATAAMMALSVPMAGKHRLCEEAMLPLLVGLLRDEDVHVRTNTVGVIMYTVITTAGKLQCLKLNVVSALLDLLTEAPPFKKAPRLMEEKERWTRKALVLYSLRALTSLAEAPEGRRLLMEQLPLLRRSCEEEEDAEVIRAAHAAIEVVTWTP
ncbi:radial spoke head 14 homolog [Gouania willdenowi]|uniref:Radial spoke head 14 homolog n=1 Tax=Gouania willdenowi TaxID=441366 RepID=A0A8C5EKB0_GOUWI|nr:radial spoke head 14 homolog [Gouania willdenowi]